jgi:selenocysteine-specific elongation factor
MRSIIVGTAGHIDHGKTALVRALTGVDTDRLLEEKRRGITIDLGFADLDLGDVHIGFVDVPGHERFIRNMLAGAHGIDLVMLVVAADEGVMPQTREHFEICRLLGVKSGIVVISKRDTVDDELLALVRAEIEELTRGSFLADAPIIATSARTGEGISELKGVLRKLSLAIEPRCAGKVMRLPIDRVFTVRGFGTVVTGTLIAGEIVEGQDVEILPAGMCARVRGLQVHGRPVERARAGQRAAVNLSGVEVSALWRGMTLAPAGRLHATRAFDSFVEVLEDGLPLRSRMSVHVHIGTAEVMARVRVLEDDGEIACGRAGFAQFKCEKPIGALPDDRFIVRFGSPLRTIAGGRVCDVHPPKHRRRELPIARARLQSLSAADETTRLVALIEMAGARGLTRAEILARTGLSDEAFAEALRGAKERGAVVEAENVFISREQFDGLVEALLDELADFHRREPLVKGMSREELRERACARLPVELFRAALANVEASGRVVVDRDTVRLSTHQPELSPSDRVLRDELELLFRRSGLEALTMEAALKRIDSAPKERARKLLKLLVDSGTLIRLDDEMLIHREALEALRERLREYAMKCGANIDVPAFKTLIGLSRKYAIPLLEYLDRHGVTRREGDARRILIAESD